MVCDGWAKRRRISPFFSFTVHNAFLTSNYLQRKRFNWEEEKVFRLLAGGIWEFPVNFLNKFLILV